MRRTAHTIEVLSITCMVWAVWAVLFTLLSGDSKLVQLRNSARYTILYGLMGQCYMLLPYSACVLMPSLGLPIP